MLARLASVRLAFFLIAILVALILLSALIPQQDIAAGQIVDLRAKLGENYAFIEKLGLDRIYYSPVFFIVLGLLAVNLAFGNIRRFRTIYRSEKTLFRLRHLGSIIFHLSLLLVMFSAILNFLYRYEGVFALTEGQTASDSATDYFREFKGQLYSGGYNRFGLKLNEIANITGETSDLGSRALITFMPTGGEPLEAEIEANHPLRWEGIEFHFGATTGYTPQLLLTDDKDSILFRSYVRVSRTEHEGRDIHHDFVMVHAENLKIAIEIYPGESEIDSTRYHLEVYRDSILLYDDILLPADTAVFGAYKLAVPSLRRWCYIGAIRNPFLSLIFFGFWAGLSGLTLSFASRLIRQR